MTRYQSQLIYGLLLIITGGIIAFLSYTPSDTMGLLFMVCGLLFGDFRKLRTPTINKKR